MKKVLLSALLGMIVLFVWGFLSWTVIHIHGSSLQPLPNGDALANQLSENLPASGVYYYPQEPAPDASDAEKNDLLEKHMEGPIFSVFYNEQGADMMNPLIFIKGLVISFLIAFLIAFIMKQVVDLLGVYIQRLLFVMGIAVLAVLGTFITQWNWMYWPTLYSLMMSFDLIIGWTLAGLVISALIKPEHKYKV
jgi:hypothetical protein